MAQDDFLLRDDRFFSVEIIMAHSFAIEKNKAGEYVAKFRYNSELIWWTEGYASKAGARNAIESVLKNGPNAPIHEPE